MNEKKYVPARLTRIRIEGSATNEMELRDYLVSVIEGLRGLYGGQWEEDSPLEVQTTRHGFWGRMTLKRTDLTEAEMKRVIG